MLIGTCSHGGYLACQRCKIRGVKIKIDHRQQQRRANGTRTGAPAGGGEDGTQGTMRYVHAGNEEKRTDEEWPTYKDQERPGEPVTDGKPHVRNIHTPFFEKLRFKMVKSTALIHNIVLKMTFNLFA